MNRRSFFQRTVGLIATALAAPYLPAPEPLLSGGLHDLIGTAGTVGGIDRATYSFWHAQPKAWSSAQQAELDQAIRDLFDQCKRGTA